MLFLGKLHPSAAVEGLGVKKEKAGRHVVLRCIPHLVVSFWKEGQESRSGLRRSQGAKAGAFWDRRTPVRLLKG